MDAEDIRSYREAVTQGPLCALLGDRMRRRAFITLLGGGVAAWPVATRAQQQRERMRSVGVLTPFAPHDFEGQNRVTAFVQALQQLGWSVGQNIRLHYRWGDGTSATMQKYAVGLVALAPDVILADSSASVAPLLQATQTIPIVFAIVGDPVGAGFVESLARPGGNITGFTPYEYGIGAKWLEVLKEIAPSVARVAVVRDPTITAGIGLWGAIQSVSPSFGVELRPVDGGDEDDEINAVADWITSRSNKRGA